MLELGSWLLCRRSMRMLDRHIAGGAPESAALPSTQSGMAIMLGSAAEEMVLLPFCSAPLRAAVTAEDASLLVMLAAS